MDYCAGFLGSKMEVTEHTSSRGAYSIAEKKSRKTNLESSVVGDERTLYHLQRGQSSSCLKGCVWAILVKA